MSKRSDAGFLFETFVLAELIKHEQTVKFFQTKKGHEVDFVIDRVHEQIGLEVKYKTQLKASDYKNLSKLSVQRNFVVNLLRQDDKHLLPFCLGRINNTP